MLDKIRIFSYFRSLFFSYFKCMVFVLGMVTGFTVNAVSRHESAPTTSAQQQQKGKIESSLGRWLSKKCASVVDFIGDIVSEPNLTTISACDENKDEDNNIHLYQMLDDNDLYS